MPVKFISFIFIIVTIMETGCANQPSREQTKSDTALAKGSFGYDLSFLKLHGNPIVLSDSSDQARVIVSAKYQGKVFTSTASGDHGRSFGWINYKAFEGTPDQHMNAYGGENRFWLGPEGGKFSLFFPKGAKMVFDNWKTPAAFDTEPWDLVSQDRQQVSLRKNMALTNYAGTNLQIEVERTISLIPRGKLFSLLGFGPDDSVKAVGYEARNKITNNGKQAWDERTGMPCIWMLDMFNPSEKTVIVVPYRRASDTVSKIVTAN